MSGDGELSRRQQTAVRYQLLPQKRCVRNPFDRGRICPCLEDLRLNRHAASNASKIVTGKEKHHLDVIILKTNSGSRISIGMFEKIRCFAQRANHFLNLHAARLGDFILNRFDVEVLSDLSHHLTDGIGECVDRREVKYI